MILHVVTCNACVVVRREKMEEESSELSLRTAEARIGGPFEIKGPSDNSEVFAKCIYSENASGRNQRGGTERM